MTIRIHNLRRLPPDIDLKTLAASRLDLPEEDILSLDVVKTTMDARHRLPVRVYSLDVEVGDPESVLERLSGDRQVGPAPPPRARTTRGPGDGSDPSLWWSAPARQGCS